MTKDVYSCRLKVDRCLRIVSSTTQQCQSFKDAYIWECFRCRVDCVLILGVFVGIISDTQHAVVSCDYIQTYYTLQWMFLLFQPTMITINLLLMV